MPRITFWECPVLFCHGCVQIILLEDEIRRRKADNFSATAEEPTIVNADESNSSLAFTSQVEDLRKVSKNVYPLDVSLAKNKGALGLAGGLAGEMMRLISGCMIFCFICVFLAVLFTKLHQLTCYSGTLPSSVFVSICMLRFAVLKPTLSH